MASDDDFFVIRRFSSLSARVILLMQNRIVQLEKIVHAEDAKCIKGEGNSDNGSFDLDCSKERQGAMDELVWRLEQYRGSPLGSLWPSLLLKLPNREIRAGPFEA